MSKLDHPAYGLSSKPHTKTKITYDQAVNILEGCVQYVLWDRAFGDKEYRWYDHNDKQVAEGYVSSKITDIYFMDYEIDCSLTYPLNESDKRYLLRCSLITNISYNDSQGE